MENSMEIPQKLKKGTASRLRDSASGNTAEETQNIRSKEHRSYAVSLTTAKLQKWSECLSGASR